jgi:hypothetical protein
LSGWVNSLGKVKNAPGSFEDKELIAVDQNPSSSYYGDVYVAWDHFFPNGTSGTYAARCTPSLACTMISGGGAPMVSNPYIFVAWSTPAVAPNGSVYLSFCNYGTPTTLGPITCSVARSGAGGSAFGAPVAVLTYDGVGPGANSPALQNATVVQGYATEQFRTSNIPVIAVDTSSGAHAGNVYWVIALCTSSMTYYGFTLPGTPGLCGQSTVYFSSSTDGGSSWSSPATISAASARVNDQPWITVDPANGAAVATFYTSQYDKFQHRLDVVAQVSTDGGSNWAAKRVTNLSDEPNSDPAYYDYTVASGFGGSFIVPQFGDYFQAIALHGQVWVLATGDYAMQMGTFQADPFLTAANE